MEEVILKAEPRKVIGKQVKALRRQGKLPGVLYGRHMEPTPILFDLHDASLILSHLASSALLTVDLQGEKHVTLVREKQRDFLLGTLLHIDLQVVSMLETLRTHVSVEFTGESPAVKDLNAILVYNVDELEVESLPSDLPEKIIVDVSTLANFGDAIHLKDLTLPPNVAILEDPNLMLVVVTAPAAEEVEEVAPVEEEVAVEPEVIEKGKKEEEEEF